MKSKRNLDVELMFEQACAFSDCAEFTESEKNIIAHRTKAHGFVNISLSALACEIFIKCLIIQNGGTYRKEHGLKDLWEKYCEIDQSQASMIESNLMTWFGYEELTKFQQMITESSDAFTQWRYVFDYDSDDGVKVNPQFLRGFRIILRSTCCKTIMG